MNNIVYFSKLAMVAAIVPRVPPAVTTVMIAGQSTPLLGAFEGTIIWHPGSIGVLPFALVTVPLRYTMYVLLFLAREP